MSIYIVTFLENFGPYWSNEQTGFGPTKAVELFCNGIASLSSDDQTTLSAEIAAYNAKNSNPSQNPEGPVNPSTIDTQPGD